MKVPRGEPTGLVCPSCGGALWESSEAGVDEYICHVGHHLSPEALQALHLGQLDHALWTAVRALHEDSIMRSHMGQHAEERGMRALAREWHAQARTAEANVAELRRLVERIEPAPMTGWLPVSAERGEQAADTPRRRKKGTTKAAPRKTGRR